MEANFVSSVRGLLSEFCTGTRLLTGLQLAEKLSRNDESGRVTTNTPAQMFRCQIISRTIIETLVVYCFLLSVEEQQLKIVCCSSSNT